METTWADILMPRSEPAARLSSDDCERRLAGHHPGSPEDVARCFQADAESLRLFVCASADPFETVIALCVLLEGEATTNHSIGFELGIFHLLRGICTLSGYPDSLMRSAAGSIVRWLLIASEEIEHTRRRARLRRDLNDFETCAKRTNELETLLDALPYALRHHLWTVCRTEDVRPFRFATVQSSTVNRCASGLLDESARSLPSPVRSSLRTLLNVSARTWPKMSPAAIDEEWAALATDGVRTLIEAAAERLGCELYQDRGVTREELLRGIEKAKAVVKRGNSTKTANVHAYRVLEINFRYLSGVRTINGKDVRAPGLTAFIKSACAIVGVPFSADRAREVASPRNHKRKRARKATSVHLSP